MKKDLSGAPEGKLRIQWRKGKPQYYWRHNPKDKTGSYLKASEIKFARSLAQKTYTQKVISAAEKEIHAITVFLHALPKYEPEQVFTLATPVRQGLISPYFETDEMIIARWNSTSYIKKPISDKVPVYQTDRGELVRSKSELMIANTLNKLGIPYLYEYPLKLKGVSENIHPDFYILNVRTRKIYVYEHFGFIDDRDYRSDMIDRIRLFEANGYFPGDNLIFTFETSLKPLSTRDIELIARHYFL